MIASSHIPISYPASVFGMPDVVLPDGQDCRSGGAGKGNGVSGSCLPVTSFAQRSDRVFNARYVKRRGVCALAIRRHPHQNLISPKHRFHKRNSFAATPQSQRPVVCGRFKPGCFCAAIVEAICNIPVAAVSAGCQMAGRIINNSGRVFQASYSQCCRLGRFVRTASNILFGFHGHEKVCVVRHRGSLGANYPRTSSFDHFLHRCSSRRQIVASQSIQIIVDRNAGFSLGECGSGRKCKNQNIFHSQTMQRPVDSSNPLEGNEVANG